MPNTLYYGDNLPILKEYIPTESVDLVYLDPPFNSNRDYNVLFSEKDGTRAERGPLLYLPESVTARLRG